MNIWHLVLRQPVRIRFKIDLFLILSILGIFVGNSIAHYNDRKEKRRNTRKTTVTPALGGPLVNLAQIYPYPYRYRPLLGV